MSTKVVKENKYIEEQFKELYDNCSQSMDEEDLALVKRAFDRAQTMHNGVRRKSGEPSILYPLSVAKIVHDELGLGAEAVACALLHDVVEDTPSTVKDIKKEFGERIGLIIDGLTKISEVFGRKNSLQAENFKKILERRRV